MKLTIVGCGDAFGSGGRFNSCYYVATAGQRFLIDCGASTLVALRQRGISMNDVDAIYISHLHGDHMGALPFILLDCQLVSKRTRPLTIVGPAGTAERYTAACEVLFPGSSKVAQAFEIRFLVHEAEKRMTNGTVSVTPFEVQHPCGSTPYALRFEADGRVLAFSGDSEWTENVARAGMGADLFLCECYRFDGAPKFHMSFEQIRANLDRIAPKRIVLTHMSDTMLARRDEVTDPRVTMAADGLVLEV